MRRRMAPDPLLRRATPRVTGAFTMPPPVGTKRSMIHVDGGVPGVNAPDPTSYREFWAFYLSQHLHPMTRRVHAAATAAAIVTGLTALARGKWRALAASP